MNIDYRRGVLTLTTIPEGHSPFCLNLRELLSWWRRERKLIEPAIDHRYHQKYEENI
jgi:hypothetical protein